MSVLSLGLRACLVASMVLVTACQQASTRDDSQYQKREGAKLDSELSKELEEERQRDKAQQTQ